LLVLSFVSTLIALSFAILYSRFPIAVVDNYVQ
jgi:hypothetical protein